MLRSCPNLGDQAFDVLLQDESVQLNLYGHADHTTVELPLTLNQRFQLFFRAIYLILVFLPFFMFGPSLMLLGAWLAALAPRPRVVAITEDILGAPLEEPSTAHRRFLASAGVEEESADSAEVGSHLVCRDSLLTGSPEMGLGISCLDETWNVSWKATVLGFSVFLMKSSVIALQCLR